jgi:IclR family transcriptional regulator, pca regulon regulatory protein
MRNSNNRYRIQSLTRGIHMLELLAQAGEPLTMSQLAEQMQMNRPTAYRFLYTLESLNLVERDPESKAYRIAPNILKLGYGVFQTSNLWKTAHPYLVGARQKYGETFNVSILDGDQILYIDRVKTRSILTINLEIGSKLPAYCTSMGRVLLAYLPRSEVRDLLRQTPWENYTPQTVSSLEKLQDVLGEVRQAGVSVNRGELALELWSAAAPIRNRDGKVVAAVNMAVNASQHEARYVEQVMIPAVLEVAAQISNAMGYIQPSPS